MVQSVRLTILLFKRERGRAYQHDVFETEIAVHDLAAVQGAEGFCNLVGIFQAAKERHRSLLALLHLFGQRQRESALPERPSLSATVSTARGRGGPTWYTSVIKKACPVLDRVRMPFVLRMCGCLF